MTKQDFLKTIPGIKKLSIVYAQTTRMPMVFCHEETFDDYVYAYLKEEDALEHVKKLDAEKLPAFVVSCKEKEVLPFLAELRLTGVNAVCFVLAGDKGREECMVQLDEFLKFPDVSSLPAEKRPVENPSLHLSMLYFMQEMRRPVPKEEKQNLTALEEETSANIARAKFLVPVKAIQDDGETNKRAIMLLKNDKGEVFIPLFTDGAEMRRFVKEQMCPVILCGFGMIADMIKKGNAAGILINPSTCNVALSKQGVAALEKRFPEVPT